MHNRPTIWSDPHRHITRVRPDQPVMYFHPATLHQVARDFMEGFSGLVTYAVKANASPEVLTNLVAAGITTFDVASPAEMEAVRSVLPDAVLHYNNPVRSADEIAEALKYGVASASIDDAQELTKLGGLPKGTEIAVRFKLPTQGAAYDFGEKFGATPDDATDLLRQVRDMGFVPSLCFHPGTQCADPNAWTAYIAAAADISRRAGVVLKRLNVGGGFAVTSPNLKTLENLRDVDDQVILPRRLIIGQIFSAIDRALGQAFDATERPTLVCEPGRAMVGEAFVLAARIKSTRHNGRTLYLNDGIYGGLAEWKDIGLLQNCIAIAPSGAIRTGQTTPRVIFGPTCDSLDRLPDGLGIPADSREGDYLLFPNMGAYSVALSSRFNGYGVKDIISVSSLAPVVCDR